jgi:hypothetical protein
MAALIPHVLAAFLRSDRGWRSRKVKVSTAVPPAKVAPPFGAQRFPDLREQTGRQGLRQDGDEAGNRQRT